MLQRTPTVRIITSHEPQRRQKFLPQIGVVSKADDSAVLEMGSTKVIAAVYGPRETQELTSLFVLRLSQIVELFTADYVFGSLMGGQQVLLLPSGVV
ncbi:hypothetical protein Bca101_011054 [Brassica carinata]